MEKNKVISDTIDRASAWEALSLSKAYKGFKAGATIRMSEIDSLLYKVDETLDTRKYSGYSVNVKKRNLILSVLERFSGKGVGNALMCEELKQDLELVESILHTVNFQNNEVLYSERDILITEHLYLSHCTSFVEEYAENERRMAESIDTEYVPEYSPGSMSFIV